jgi:hypothetical protein
MTPCPDCGRVHDPSRPSIAHYWRPNGARKWRAGGTTVNASPCAVPTLRRLPEGLYADVPYDWEVWTPPKTASVLPGVTAEMIRALT